MQTRRTMDVLVRTFPRAVSDTERGCVCVSVVVSEFSEEEGAPKPVVRRQFAGFANAVNNVKLHLPLMTHISSIRGSHPVTCVTWPRQSAIYLRNSYCIPQWSRLDSASYTCPLFHGSFPPPSPISDCLSAKFIKPGIAEAIFVIAPLPQFTRNIMSTLDKPHRYEESNINRELLLKVES